MVVESININIGAFAWPDPAFPLSASSVRSVYCEVHVYSTTADFNSYKTIIKNYIKIGV